LVAEADAANETVETTHGSTGPGTQLDLDRALARLPVDERLCIVLAYSEGMSHSEISESTGMPLGTVKSHIRRGSQELRVLLRAYGPIESTGDARGYP
jgi:RNA polymerase sigma-70 factor (ECF subfamily)